MEIFDADDPLVLNGTYDVEGYKPGERQRIRQAQERQDTMAKKPKSKPKGKPAPRYRATNGTGKSTKRPAPRPTPRRRSPRSQSLPGMAQVRDAKLDAICEAVGDGLDQITAGTHQVDEGKLAAKQRLHDRGLQSYRHAGVRLMLVPGDERVAVKKLKDHDVDVAEAPVTHSAPEALSDADPEPAAAE